jgi:hypothetical protein
VRKKRLSLFDRATSAVEAQLVANSRCRRLLAVSTITKEAFIGECDVGNRRVLVLPSGMDVARFAGLDRECLRAEVRRASGADA